MGGRESKRISDRRGRRKDRRKGNPACGKRSSNDDAGTKRQSPDKASSMELALSGD